MNALLKRTGASLAALAIVCCSLATAVAQNLKPVAVVSIASVLENLNDVAYVTRVAGMEDQGETVRFLAGAMASGIDKDRPIGLYIVPKDEAFEGILFVPLAPNGLQTILKIHKDKLGEPKDAGGGILQVGLNNTAFLKEVRSPNQQGGWVFAAAEKEHLANLPADPVTLLGDMPKKYNVAAKLIVQNIPEKLRRTALDEIKLGIERFLDSPQARQGNIDREQARTFSGAQVANIERLMNEADELMIGLGIDEQAKRINFDVSFAGKEGTSLARGMAIQADAKTNYSGFLQPDASVAVNVASKATPEDIAQATAALQMARAQWTKQIDDAPGIPADKRDAIKALIGPIVDVLTKSVSTGRFDGGATVVLNPKSLSFAIGGLCADGPQVEKILRSVSDILRDLPNLPKLQVNAATIGDMKISKLTYPIPPANPARDILGDTLEVLFAVSPTSFYAAGGKEGAALLKKIVDRSAQDREKAVAPVSVNVAVLPILKFLKSFDENNPQVGGLIASLEASGNDRVTVTNQPAPRSSTTHIEIQEGVIRALGTAIKNALGRLQRGGE